MFASLACLSQAGLLLLVSPLVAAPAAPPVSVSVRITSGPWGGWQYTIAARTLTVREIPAIRATAQAPQPVFKTSLPADAAHRRIQALNLATYQALPNEMLDGGSVLVVDLQQGNTRQSARYQSGQYARLDPTTAFLLTYINQHVPAKLAIGADWLKPAAGGLK